jgi:uncharacterized membrane protein
METFFTVNRYVHIAAGFLGFFMAPVALAVQKGGVAHRRWGRVFFWAMAVAGTTALVGAQHIHSLFCSSRLFSASTWRGLATAPCS